MSFFCKSGLLFLTMFWAVTSHAGEGSSVPLWPLDLSERYLTSNFMEYRSGRFHAGLDLKTQSREGFAVHAVEDGYISRVRCTPTAYGRVVYLRGISGKTYVFAHLSRFNDEIRSRVEAAQVENNSYRARLEFSPGTIPIKKGQVLGVSGQSGTGGPHLHFEVRDRSQRPVNPLDYGFTVGDKLAPVIHRLRAWPVKPSSRINGGTGEWVLDPSGQRGLAGNQGVLNISGPVAFSARMIDASDIRGHKLEPWNIEIILDGKTVYQCQNKRYAFSENALQRLEWTDRADMTDAAVPREHWLHRRSSNTLTGRSGSLWYFGDSGEGLSIGEHSLELKVQDHAGQETALNLILRVQEQARPDSSSLWKSQPLGLVYGDSAECVLTPFFSTGSPEKLGFNVLKLNPKDNPEVLENVELWWRETIATAQQLEVAEKQGLQPLGNPVFYGTADWPIESSVQVPYPENTQLESGKENVGLYRLNGKGQWDLVTQLTDSSVSSFLMDKPGLHGVFQDFGKPVLRNPGVVLTVLPGKFPTIEDVTFSQWELSPIAMADPGSGIDTGTIITMLDGVSIIAEPDSPRDRLLVHWPDKMVPGKHLFYVEVTDHAGNTAVATYDILVQEE